MSRNFAKDPHDTRSDGSQSPALAPSTPERKALSAEGGGGGGAGGGGAGGGGGPLMPLHLSGESDGSDVDDAVMRKHEATRRGRERMRAWGLATLAIPVDFGWAAGEAMVVPHLLSMGVSISACALLWVLPPILGMLFQPAVSYASDASGNRKQFIFACAVLAAVGLIAILLTSSVPVVYAGFCAVDLSHDLLSTLTRAYVNEATPTRLREDVNAAYSFMSGVGRLGALVVASSPLELILAPFGLNTRLSAVFFVSAVLNVAICGAAVYFGPPDRPPSTRRRPRKRGTAGAASPTASAGASSGAGTPRSIGSGGVAGSGRSRSRDGKGSRSRGGDDEEAGAARALLSQHDGHAPYDPTLSGTDADSGSEPDVPARPLGRSAARLGDRQRSAARDSGADSSDSSGFSRGGAGDSGRDSGSESDSDSNSGSSSSSSDSSDSGRDGNATGGRIRGRRDLENPAPRRKLRDAPAAAAESTGHVVPRVVGSSSSGSGGGSGSGGVVGAAAAWVSSLFTVDAPHATELVTVPSAVDDAEQEAAAAAAAGATLNGEAALSTDVRDPSSGSTTPRHVRSPAVDAMQGAGASRGPSPPPPPADPLVDVNLSCSLRVLCPRGRALCRGALCGTTPRPGGLSRLLGVYGALGGVPKGVWVLVAAQFTGWVLLMLHSFYWTAWVSHCVMPPDGATPAIGASILELESATAGDEFDSGMEWGTVTLAISALLGLVFAAVLHRVNIRFGTKRVYWVALVALAVASLAMAHPAGRTPGAALALAIVGGVSDSVYYDNAFVLLEEMLPPREHAQYVSLLTNSMTVAQLLVSIAGWLTTTSVCSVTNMFAVAGAFALVIQAACIFVDHKYDLVPEAESED